MGSAVKSFKMKNYLSNEEMLILKTSMEKFFFICDFAPDPFKNFVSFITLAVPRWLPVKKSLIFNEQSVRWKIVSL
jgi:hypothetical protein